MTSLPVPDSPCRKTVASVGATRAAAPSTACQAGEEPSAVVRSTNVWVIGSSLIPRTELEHAREAHGNDTKVSATPRCGHAARPFTHFCWIAYTHFPDDHLAWRFRSFRGVSTERPLPSKDSSHG